MKIERILNNNVVIIKNDKGIDEVVCGKGVAFKKKIGDVVDKDLVNQTFILKDEKYNARFQEIVSNIPFECIEIADEVINLIKTDLGTKISDVIYITLSDHMYAAIERKKEGISLRNPLKLEIKRFYENEYKLGLKAIKIIKEKTGVELAEDEAAFIALHIVNSQVEYSNLNQTMKVTKIIQEVSNIVKYFFSTEFNVDSVYYYRFITHLKYFAQRIVFKKIYDSEDDGLLDIIKQKYDISYRCVEKIEGFVSKKYGYYISDEEKIYLTVHIERAIYKQKGNTLSEDK